MPPALPPEDNEEYNSASDSDFDASASPSTGEESDEIGEAAPTKAKAKGKPTKRKFDADGDLEMGSGDEGIIAQGEKKKRKKGKGKGKKGEQQPDDAGEEGGDEDEGSDGVGIRVRLRSGRGGRDDSSKKPSSTNAAVNVNIDDIWARMNTPRSSQTINQRPPSSPPTNKDHTVSTPTPFPSKDTTALEPASENNNNNNTMIQIPHTYTFAGETHTSYKPVPRSSKEAQAYLSTAAAGSTTSGAPTKVSAISLRRPLARHNLLDPNPTRLVAGLPSQPRADLPASIGGNGTLALTSKVEPWKPGRRKRGPEKINTVEKSKMDWEAEVERQGLREELDRAEKAGGSYLGRMEFLGRVEGRGEERERIERLKGMGAQANTVGGV